MKSKTHLKYKKDYFGYVYIWYDRYRKKFCIGSHYGSLYDNYTSSTGHFKAAYKKRPQDFKMKVLDFLFEDDKELLLELEHRWLQMIKPEELGIKYYNRTTRRGSTFKNKPKRQRRKLSDDHKEKLFTGRDTYWENMKAEHPERFNRDKRHTLAEPPWRLLEHQKTALINGLNNYYKNLKLENKPRIPWNKGVPMKEEQKKLISEVTMGRPAWNKGLPNPTAAANGKKGAKKMAEVATGRKRKYKEDGTWTWEYPNKKA